MKVRILPWLALGLVADSLAQDQEFQAMDSRNAAERRQLDAVNERQLREVKPDSARELQPQERQRAEEERRAIVVPR